MSSSLEVHKGHSSRSLIKVIDIVRQSGAISYPYPFVHYSWTNCIVQFNVQCKARTFSPTSPRKTGAIHLEKHICRRHVLPSISSAWSRRRRFRRQLVALPPTMVMIIAFKNKGLYITSNFAKMESLTDNVNAQEKNVIL